MEEILALQKQLQEVQETKTQFQLSERVIVELVQNVIKRYDQKLYFSTDGQEYIIPEYLDSQVNDIIQSHGRINIVDIPNLVNVGIEIIENRIDGIQSRFQNLIRLDDQLMTQEYLDGICEEINEDLQQRSQIAIGEITQKYGFPVQFVNKVIEDRLNTIIQGNILQGDKLTTISFQNIMKSKLKGCLRAVLKPYSVNSIIKEYGIDKVTLNEIMDDLIQNQEIDGKVQGGMFIPTKFVKTQENIIKKFFKQNKYIEYDFLSKQLFIQKPKEILKSLFKDNCIHLENCCFNKAELKYVQENIEAILQEEGFTDLLTILPSVLTDQDIESLLFKHMGLTDVLLNESWIFSQSYIYKCTQSFREPIVQLIYKQPQKLIIEDEEQASAGGKKGKGKKGKTQLKKNNSTKQGLFTDSEIMEHLVKSKILDQDDRDDYFDNMLTKLIQPEIAKFYDQIKVELFENKKSASSEIINEISGKIIDLLISIQFVSRGFQYIEENYSTVDITHLMDHTMYASRMLLENIVIFFCKKYCVQLPTNLFLDDKQLASNPVQQNTTQQSHPPYIDCGNIIANKTFKNKAALVSAIESMPKEYSKFLSDGMKLYLKKQFYPLLEHFKNGQEIIGIKAILDKKSEKNYTFYIRYQMKEAIKKNQNDFLMAKSVFLNILTIILLEKHNLYFIGNKDINDKLFIQICLIITDVSQDQSLVDNVKKAMQLFQDLKTKGAQHEETLKNFQAINTELLTKIKL